MPSVEEQATGCVGANSYKQYARDRGYTHIEVLDWTSSAGDWQFLVSKDGHEWFVLFQENNYPRGPGFSHQIDEGFPFIGTLEEVYKEIEERQSW